jgi:hypothetical protein
MLNRRSVGVAGVAIFLGFVAVWALLLVVTSFNGSLSFAKLLGSNYFFLLVVSGFAAAGFFIVYRSGCKVVGNQSVNVSSEKKPLKSGSSVASSYRILAPGTKILCDSLKYDSASGEAEVVGILYPVYGDGLEASGDHAEATSEEEDSIFGEPE